MARVVMYQLVLKETSIEEAHRLVNEVLDGTVLAAKAMTAPGTGPYTTGHLSSTIEKEGPHITGRLVTGAVNAKASYAQIAHDGARVHDIFPKDAPHLWRFGSRRRPQLKFYWRRAGRTVYAPHIPMSPHYLGRSHPGYKGKKFLTTPLRTMARIFGFKYLTTEL